MLIIPAVDIRNGRVVRLTQGLFDQETVYSQAPEEVVKRWQLEGARLIHVVDLDGALHGHRRNLGSLKNILATTKVPVQFGGGLRSFEAVNDVIQTGVARVIIGTKASDLDLLKKLVKTFTDRIIVGIDIRNNVIQTHGWQIGETEIDLEVFLKQIEDIGVRTVICTDISRDGMLSGPNFDLLQLVLKKTKMDVILSGGISELSHLEQLSKLRSKHFKGVIVGKALYERKFLLKDAIKQFQKNV